MGVQAFGTVAGIVTDSDTGSPIVNAILQVLATSGIDGSFSFDIAIGTYDFTCTADNYFDLEMDNVVIEEAQTTYLNFAMSSSYPPEDVLAEIVDYNDVVITWAIPSGS